VARGAKRRGEGGQDLAQRQAHALRALTVKVIYGSKKAQADRSAKLRVALLVRMEFESVVFVQ